MRLRTAALAIRQSLYNYLLTTHMHDCQAGKASLCIVHVQYCRLQLLFTYLLHLQTLIFIHNWLKKFGCSYFLPIAPTSCWFCQRSVPQLVRFNQRILFLQRKAHLFNLRAFSHVYFLWRCHVSLVLHNSFLLFHWPTSPCARCLCASICGSIPPFCHSS